MSASSGTVPPRIQAILLATSTSPAYGPITEHVSIEMLPLANQPFIGRVVGCLVALGIKDIIVMASHRVDLLSNFLGDGTRWGGKVKVIAVANEAQVYARLPELAISDFTLLGLTAALPGFNGEGLLKATNNGGALFQQTGAQSTGWCLARREFFNEAVRDCKRMDDFEKILTQFGTVPLTALEPVLRLDSPSGLIQSTRAILDGQRPEQIIPGASAESGVYISRNVVIHPTAQIIQPVVIGADCNIDRGARIGPYVVIGEKSILGAHTTLENATVFPGTYIGPHLELTNVVVDHNCLAYGDATGAVPVPDPFLLSSSEGRGFWHGFGRLVSRLFGMLALVIFSPLILLFWLLALLCGVRSPVLNKVSVKIPAASDPALWQSFHYCEFDTSGKGIWQSLIKFLRVNRLPTLWNVAGGSVTLIGLRPLSVEELKALHSDWRQIYIGGSVGMIRLAELDQLHSGEESDDQTYSSEAYYVATVGYKTNLRILWRRLWHF